MSEDPVAAFLSSLMAERGAAQNTLDAYRRDLADYERALAAAGRSPLDADRGAIEAWLADLARQGFALSTRGRRLSAVKQLHAFLFAEDWRADDPASRIRGPGKPRTLPRVMSVEEVSRLLEAAREGEGHGAARRACLLEILYASGMRVSELVSLPVGPLRAAPRAVRIKGKGGRERLAPLSDRAREALSAYLPLRDARPDAKSGYLFPSRGASGHLTRVRFFQILRDLAAQAGLDPAGVSPHTLRHAFATHLLANGADLRVIQTLLGHQDIATTEIYTHVLDDDLRELVLTRHPLAQKP